MWIKLVCEQVYLLVCCSFILSLLQMVLLFQFSNMVPDFVITGPQYRARGPAGYLCAGFWNFRWDFRPELVSCPHCIWSWHLAHSVIGDWSVVYNLVKWCKLTYDSDGCEIFLTVLSTTLTPMVMGKVSSLVSWLYFAIVVASFVSWTKSLYLEPG